MEHKNDAKSYNRMNPVRDRGRERNNLFMESKTKIGFIRLICMGSGKTATCL